MTRNFQNAINKNRYIADEVAKHGRVLGTHDRPQGGFFMKKASEETLIERDRSFRYEGKRANRCEVCHTTKALGSGECLCS